jgi:hypothetical protein
MNRSPGPHVTVHPAAERERPRHPDRRPTLVFQESFSFIKRIQDLAAADCNLPAIDHGILVSAALALVAEMPEAPQRVIDRALELIVERRHKASRSN